MMARITTRSLHVARVCAAILLAAGGLLAVQSAVSAATSPCGPGSNPIVCENSKPGTPESVWDVTGVGDPTIQGFATDMSVNIGQTEYFKISTDASAYTIDIYRLGWYGGDGARKIASITPSAALPQNQPACITDPATQLVDCGDWAVSASWTVPTTAVSGVYLAVLTRTDTSGQSQIPFVVRDDSSHSDIVFQTSDTTWEAYNTYGGADFYTGSNGRAYKISYNRPFSTRGDNDGRDYLFSNEYPMIRFLERNGYDVSYISGVDTARNGSLLLNHRIFLSVGHDEYWSGEQRANVEAARDAGVNLAFFSGNEIYWKTRWEPSVDGSNTPYRTLVSYKETWANGPIDPLEPTTTTATWRDPRFGPPINPQGDGYHPENALSGTMYMSNTGGFAIQVPYPYSRDRIWRNTSVASLGPGQTATLAPNTLGYEFDSDVDNGFRPAGLIDLSSTVESVPQKMIDYGNTVAQGTVTHSLTLYRAPSGALVFSAGTVQWAWGLDDDHDGTTSPADPRMQQATVNLFADMGVQPQTLMSGLVPASPSTDTTPPTVTISSPTSSSTLTVASPVTISGTASDLGGVVAGVEVSVDGGQTWHPATGTTSWQYTWTPTTSGQVTLEVRATDDSVNMSSPVTEVVTVAPRGCPCTIWPTSSAPPPPPQITASSGEGAGSPDYSESDPSSVEVGVKFQPTEDGYVTGVRFYKLSTNTGTHVGSLWSSSGQLLATATFTNETTSGWQQVTFATPVAVKAGQTYIASYHAPNGHYAAQPFYFETSGVTSEPLVAPSGPAIGGNGVFAYGSGTIFPNQSYDNTNYWVDVVFVTPDHSVTVSAVTPANGATGAATTTPITATFTGDVDPGSVVFQVRQNGLTINGTTSYDTASRTATFTPSTPLAAGTPYTVTLDARAAASGLPIAPYQWSFTTTNAAPCPCSFWPSAGTPSAAPANDSLSVNLGLRFTPAVNGYVTGVKFYKGVGNGGTHVGSLWTAAGQLLATATFTNETTTGWQQVNFATPVAVSAGTTYVVSYLAPQGHYTATPNFFTGTLTVGPLTALVSPGNGVFTYAATNAFPSQSYQASNYWVDPIFTDVQLAPQVVATNPAAGATNVDPTAGITATFDKPVTSPSVTVVLDASGAPVSGTVTLSTAGTTVTFTPSSALPAGSVIDVTVQATAAADGVPSNPYAWSFTTAGTAPTCPCALWNESAAPAVAAVDDASSVELGVKFTTSRDGYVSAIKFYKGNGNTGTHVGHLWSADGTLLASVTFTNESATGWQVAVFSLPVPVKAGQTYIASYYAPNGHYAATGGYFNAAYSNGPLTALSSGGSGGNGVFRYGTGGGFPSSSYNATNYWVDVVFSPPSSGATVATVSPAAGSTGAPTTSPVSVTFSGAVDPSSVALTVTDTGMVLTGTLTYDATTYTATWTPAAPFSAGTTYTVNVTAVDPSTGLSIPPYTWSFTTAADPSGCPCSLWSAALQPNAGEANDPNSVVVGVKFTPTADGYITGIRFYKSTNDTGVHSGSLWTASGQLLARATFANESATGWQTVTFSTPVAVTAGQTYVASYFAPNGHYVASPNSFAAARSAGPLVAPASADVGGNGVYSYSPVDTFPTNTYNATNYWVDVLYTASPPPPPSVPCPCSIWSAATVPVQASVNDGSSVELGLRFETTQAGFITGIRFYKGAGNDGTHTGSLWDASGNLLATVTFTNETASGWQEADFTAPVPVQPGAVYVASYYAPNGHYAADPGYFTSNGVSSGPLVALSSPAAQGNGVYRYGSGGVMPTDSYNATNYWVDVVFTSN